MPADPSVAIYRHFPLVRAVRSFEETERSCLFPASKKTVLSLTKVPVETVLESTAIDRVSAHIMVRKGTPSIGGIADLAGKTIAVQQGVSLLAKLGQKVTFKEFKTPNDKVASRMLAAGRVDGMYGWNPDAFWSWVPDSYILFEKMGYGAPSLALDRPVFVSSTHFLCQKTAATEALMQDVNRAIRVMRADGRLKEILGPYARIVGVDVPLEVTR